MRTGTLCLAATGIVVLLCANAGAQWTSYPAQGLPRLANGQVDPKAPTPKAPDGRPDLSGIWQRGRPPKPPQRPPVSGSYENFLSANSKIDMQPWAEALYRKRSDNFGAGIPSERCLPHSFQHQILIGEPFQVIQGPILTTILFEESNHFRQVFTDGRNHPAERTPSWFGYSIGKWEGDAFVVDTVGFRDQAWLDLFGHPGTEALRTIERYRRPDLGHLELTITIDDPSAYAKSWSADVQFDLMADANLIENVCENERSAQHIVGK